MQLTMLMFRVVDAIDASGSVQSNVHTVAAVEPVRKLSVSANLRATVMRLLSVFRPDEVLRDLWRLIALAGGRRWTASQVDLETYWAWATAGMSSGLYAALCTTDEWCPEYCPEECVQRHAARAWAVSTRARRRALAFLEADVARRLPCDVTARILQLSVEGYGV